MVNCQVVNPSVALNSFPSFLNNNVATRLSSYCKGVVAESNAEQFLKKNGYQILGRRVKTKFGEIDILAKKGFDVVAVEVKLRKKFSDAFECISYRQKSRIANAFLSIISKRNDMFESYRVDVICLDLVGHLEHIENAFYIEDFSTF